MEIVEKGLLAKIDEAKAKLDSSKIPEMTRDIFRIMEDQVMLNTTMQDGDNAARKDQVMKNFRKAWEYSEQNFPGKVDLIYLTDIGGMVEPDIKELGISYAPIRKGKVKWDGGYVPPSDEARVRVHLDRMMKAAESSKMHPVEEAVYYNFHLTRIQPFENGNKRTANIIMNAILKNNGFLPVSITKDKIGEYASYLYGAVQGFRENGAESDPNSTIQYVYPDFKQKQFYDFLARNELFALRCAENRMFGLEQYTIFFDSNDVGADFTLKRRLESYFQSQKKVHQVRLNRRERVISLTGEIPYRILEKMVFSSAGIKRAVINLKD